jgi:hypothetical protein
MEILEPKAGAVFAPGDLVKVKAIPSSGESVGLVHFYNNLRDDVGTHPFDFIPPYEWEFTIPLQHTGIVEIVAAGATPKGSNSPRLPPAEIAITVILPPTTVLQGIEARMASGKSGTIYLYRDLTGSILRNVSNELEVKGFYSDSVKRDISIDSGTTYISSDQKVVRPKEIDQEDKVMILEAVSSGSAVITVRNGSLEDTVSVEVEEEECPPEAIREYKGAVQITGDCRPLKKK